MGRVNMREILRDPVLRRRVIDGARALRAVDEGRYQVGDRGVREGLGTPDQEHCMRAWAAGADDAVDRGQAD